MNYIKKLCMPAFIYFMMSAVAIFIDIYYGLINDAVQKGISLVIITYLLDTLCKKGYDSVSWFIVFLPFVTLFLIILTVIFIFGAKNLPDNNIKRLY